MYNKINSTIRDSITSSNKNAIEDRIKWIYIIYAMLRFWLGRKCGRRSILTATALQAAHLSWTAEVPV